MVIQVAARCIGLYGVRCHGQRATAKSLYGKPVSLFTQRRCAHRHAGPCCRLPRGHSTHQMKRAPTSFSKLPESAKIAERLKTT